MTDKQYSKILTATIALTVTLGEPVHARNEIACPPDSEDGAICWKCGDTCTAKLETSGKMTISGTGDMYNFSRSSDYVTDAPWESVKNKITYVEIGKDITSIGDNSFRAAANLRKLDTTKATEITIIGDGAFSRSNLENVYLGANTKIWKIGTYAFAHLNPANFIMPASVTAFGEYPFYSTSFSGGFYCTAEQNSKGKVCANHQPWLPALRNYEENNGIFTLYNREGSIIGRWNASMTQSYDAKGNVIAKYDENGTMRYAKDENGSDYYFDGNGNLTGMTKRGPFTIPEANALTKDGPVNTVTITW